MIIKLSRKDTWKLLYLLSGMPEPVASDLAEFRTSLHRATTNELLKEREVHGHDTKFDPQLTAIVKHYHDQYLKVEEAFVRQVCETLRPKIEPGMIVNSKYGVGVVHSAIGGTPHVITAHGACSLDPENHVEPITAQCRLGRFAFGASPAQDTIR